MAPLHLSSAASIAYLNNHSTLPDLTCSFSDGLEAATKAIFHAKLEIPQVHYFCQVIREYADCRLYLAVMLTTERNAALACLVRAVANEHGWLAGWQCLAKACPDSGMHETLMDDIRTGVKVFQSVEVSTATRTSIDVKFGVKTHPEHGNIHEIGPKSIGGHGWKSHRGYKKAMEKWLVSEDLHMAPCPFFAWVGVAKKVPSFNNAVDAAAFWTAQFLGIVDYDFDKDKSNMPKGLKPCIERTAKVAVELEGGMRGAAWIGMVTLDQQLFNRHVQLQWVSQGFGSFVAGPANISPRDFAIAGYVDCAALAPFAYQKPEELLPSRKAMFVAVLFANLHDFLYDIGSSSRISCAGYAAGSGHVFEHDLQQAFVVGFIDDMATNALNRPLYRSPTYGENALFATCVWDIFNVRYRAWERFVKYTRILERSESKVATRIIKRAEDGMILPAQHPDTDIGETWEFALDIKNIDKLIPRSSYAKLYTLPDSFEAVVRHQLLEPKLCGSCLTTFRPAFLRLDDVLEAVPGIPDAVLKCDSVCLAAAIRRACLWATSSDCCDSCACAVGIWANNSSDGVTIALMQSEQYVTPRDWLLENYVIGCVAFSPLRLITILNGFDTSVDMMFEAGAMGERDIVDC